MCEKPYMGLLSDANPPWFSPDMSGPALAMPALISYRARILKAEILTKRQSRAWEDMPCTWSVPSLILSLTCDKPPFVVPMSGSTQSNPDLLCAFATHHSAARTNRAPIFARLSISSRHQRHRKEQRPRWRRPTCCIYPSIPYWLGRPTTRCDREVHLVLCTQHDLASWGRSGK